MNEGSQVRSETFKYALYGIFFGFLFPIVATVFDIYRYDLNPSWKAAFFIQKTYPIHFIIDTAPVFLGLFAGFGGFLMGRLKDNNQQILKTSKFRQDFLANMSHEIRTPMVGVIGMIDLLSKNTKLDTVQKEYVQTIHQSSQNLLNIINQILDLSKIESGKLTFIEKPTDFKRLVNQNIDLFTANCETKGISLISEFDENIPLIIEIDQNRFTQILSNLITNAIKFTKKGSITVRSSLLPNSDKKVAILKIEVIDTGIGISEKDQKKLFDRFNQIQNTNLVTEKGSGLGLAISRKLVDHMHGEMGVTSKLNEGSNFWFTFNARIPSAVKIHPEITFDYNKDKQYNLHVLLVEDSETNILVSQQILGFLGCSSVVARTGKEAIEIFKEQVYDLILMDINLPELDGVQTTRLLRERFDKVPPVIAITSNALPGDAEHFIAQGLDDYITKPFTTETVHIKLKNWFGDHNGYH